MKHCLFFLVLCFATVIQGSHVDCPHGWFRCRNWVCILSSSVCDGDNDCGDWSDETACTPSCSPYHFMCDLTTCISQTSLCDGVYHCRDLSDEMNCKKNHTAIVFGAIFGGLAVVVAILAIIIKCKKKENPVRPTRRASLPLMIMMGPPTYEDCTQNEAFIPDPPPSYETVAGPIWTTQQSKENQPGSQSEIDEAKNKITENTNM